MMTSRIADIRSGNLMLASCMHGKVHDPSVRTAVLKFFLNTACLLKHRFTP